MERIRKENQLEGSVADDADRLGGVRIFAWLSLFWERFWPLVVPFVCVVALFLTISFLGIWPLIPNAVRILLLGVFVVGSLAALYPLRSLALPDAAAVDSRIERKSGLQHRPVTAQQDHRADLSGTDDAFSRALWAEHQSRMARSMRNLKSGIPVPMVASRDPYALRAIAGLLLFVGVAAGWGNWSARIGDAFTSHVAQQLAQAGRIDAWVTPPAYTNRPPIFLNREVASVTVPEGSEFFVRAADLDAPSLVMLIDGKEQLVPEAAPEDDKNHSISENAKSGTKQVSSYKVALGSSSSIKLRSGEDDVLGWSFTILPDRDPEIEFSEDPKSSIRGALEFAYGVKDDYGVIAATAEIVAKKKPNVSEGAKPEPLVAAPRIDLPLPSRRATKGTSKTSQDLSSHPWAGAEVVMTLVAEDEAGQKGRSEPKSFTLPERIFTKPLALAIVEERRNLALDVNAAPKVAEMLDIITTTHPDELIKDVATYTALRVVYRSVSRNQDHDALRETLDLMWDIALAIEDGDLSLAERRLRDAQERLSKALENGASDEEIEKLMQELRTAMDEFMRELAEQMAKNPQNQQAMPMDPNAQVLRRQDLEQMMKQIEDLAKSGSKDAARQLLQEMQRMMNNLQTARPGQQQQQQNDEFSKQMNKLGEMMRQQQELMDQTFDMQRRQQQQQQQNQQNQQGQQGEQNQQQQNQQGQRGEQKPMTPEEFAEAMKELQRQQGELQRQMQELQDGLREQGLDPGKKLGEAGEAMGEAETQLGQGEFGEATGQQGRALQAMREGAQQMMQNMQNQAGEQGRRGERGQHGQQSRDEQDPLGRQSRSQGPQLGNDTKVPGEIDAQRAREILDSIRRKLGETTRPKLELDYLDRLLPTR